MTERFEEFLQEKHAEQYLGTDDNMPDNFNDWLGYLEVEEWLNYGEQFGIKLEKDILEKNQEAAKEKK